MRSGKGQAALDGIVLGAAGSAVPYFIPTVIRTLRREFYGSEDSSSPDEKIPGSEMATMLGSFIATGTIGYMTQMHIYKQAIENGYGEALAIPVVTNAISLAYEMGGNKLIERVKNYLQNRKNERDVERVREESSTLKEKLTLWERLVGSKKHKLDLKAHVEISPKVTVYVNNEKQKDVRVEVDNPVAPHQETSLDSYLVGKEPFYISLNGEKEMFTHAAANKLPVMLKGPTGCGKTRFLEHMAYQLKRPLITVNCQEDLSASDLAGRILLNEDGTYWQDGPLAKAARHGGICYLDEVIEARNDAMVLIHSLTDHRRILPIDKTGEVIQAHPDFMLVVSYNPHYQSALKDMKQSTRQRFVALEFDYPQKDHEVEILQKESGIDRETATKLVDFGQAVRNMKKDGLAEGASTRLLVNAGKLIKSGVGPIVAVEGAIIDPITDEQDLQKVARDVASTMFGG